MDSIIIIGSGASGVHFALSVLRKGYRVTMIDVGYARPPMPNPLDNFSDLKTNLSDPVQYYLGQQFDAIIYPGADREYFTKPYALPPNKNYVFAKPSIFEFTTKGFEPLFSFTQGGLAEAWTGGVYPFNDDELKEFPFSYQEIDPAYSEVAKRIGIVGVRDDLTKFFPYHDNLLEPLSPDEHTQRLLADYEQHKASLRRDLRTYIGRSRVATLSTALNGREACSYCGRCLWGCPSQSLYTPSITLDECRRYSNFTYIPNMLVRHFKLNAAQQVTSVVAEEVTSKVHHEFAADKFVLAAGTLSSSKIFMDSILKATGRIVRLNGLMDNRQILIPFVNLRLVGKSYNPARYQYHQLALGIESDQKDEYIHGQITTLKSALVHPIIHNVPFDLRTSTLLFRNVRAGLGVVNLNLHHRRSTENHVTLEPDPQADSTKLVIHYETDTSEKARIKKAVQTVKKVLWRLGCVVPPGMTHVRPMGSSVHYAGTIPMSTDAAPHTASKFCQSHDFPNLYFADGVTFPFLPAKNITFTLMANAVRVADAAF